MSMHSHGQLMGISNGGIGMAASTPLQDYYQQMMDNAQQQMLRSNHLLAGTTAPSSGCVTTTLAHISTSNGSVLVSDDPLANTLKWEGTSGEVRITTLSISRKQQLLLLLRK